MSIDCSDVDVLLAECCRSADVHIDTVGSWTTRYMHGKLDLSTSGALPRIAKAIRSFDTSYNHYLSKISKSRAEFFLTWTPHERQ